MNPDWPESRPLGAACSNCNDTGHVCENHPTLPWGGMCCNPRVADLVSEHRCRHGACHCGGAGMPCPTCCDPIPGDGTQAITEAFIPGP